MTDQTLQSIIDWFKIAKPNPTNQDIIKQIAFHCEEFAEMLDAINCQYMSIKVRELKKELMTISHHETASNNYIAHVDKVKLLDSLCDQVVTSTGVAVLASMNFIPALQEINRSNYTKFTTDEHGNPVPFIDANGKIAKNIETYKKPKLEQFLGS